MFNNGKFNLLRNGMSFNIDVYQWLGIDFIFTKFIVFHQLPFPLNTPYEPTPHLYAIVHHSSHISCFLSPPLI